jgi:gliding motility-associated lipoprotein GldD
MAKENKIFIFLLLGLLALGSSCRKEYTPRPRGYYRISFPAKRYKAIQMPLPYSFQIPVYSIPGNDSLNLKQRDWVTIEVPANHAQIHLSYKKINKNLGEYIEESRTLAYKHSEKASSIEEQVFMNPSKKVFGTIYNIKGNAASPMQFYLTDSVEHFLRGSLYIKEIPNIDSLQPVIEFLNQDVIRLIETTVWKERK